MTEKTLLQIIQEVAATINLPQPSAVIGSSDLQVQQLEALANEEGKYLGRRFSWEVLTKEGTFTTVATETQSTLAAATGGGSSDYGLYIPDTMWDRTQKWPVHGPLNNAQWQALKASGLNASVGSRFRIRGGSILFYPTPTAGNSIYFEYISRNWILDAGGVTYAKDFANDEDTPLLDAELIKLGIKWRFLRAKGLAYGEEFVEYERAVEIIAGHDGAKEIIHLDGNEPGLTLTLPEDSWDLSL